MLLCHFLTQTYRLKKGKRSRDKSANAKDKGKFETLWDVVLYMTNIRPGSGTSTNSSGGSSGIDTEEVKKEYVDKWKAK